MFKFISRTFNLTLNSFSHINTAKCQNLKNPQIKK